MQLVPWTGAGLAFLRTFTAQQILLALIHTITSSHDVYQQNFSVCPLHFEWVKRDLIQVIHAHFEAEMM